MKQQPRTAAKAEDVGIGESKMYSEPRLEAAKKMPD
jgi:hypothetical protein